jgi:GT2 family glycosyltransferase
MRFFKKLERSLKKRLRRGRQRLRHALAYHGLRACFHRRRDHPLSSGVYSWVLPVSAGEIALARKTVRSLQNQISGRWELVLVPWGTRSPALDEFLAEAAAAAPALVVAGDPRASPVEACVDGTRAAGGTWVGYLRPQGRLEPEALIWLDLATADDPGARWFYSDERYRTGGKRCVNFKPDFSVEHLWSQPFTGQLSIYHKSLLDRWALPTTEFGDAWQHDLGLRLSEVCRPEQIRHIPVALHETVLPHGEVESFLRCTPEHHAATRAALARRQVAAEVIPGSGPLALPRIRLRACRRPRVAVVIPTRDHADLVIPCVASLRESTRYPNYKIVVIDNQSREPGLLEFLAADAAQGRLQVHRHDRPFNHSEMHNEAILALDAEYVVLLNNDVYGFSADWLEELVGTAELDDRIAAVGAQLFYPDDTVQHAGVFLGFGGSGIHSHIHRPRNTDGYFGRLNALQEYSALTAALLLLRRSAFRKVGGFDPIHFPTSYNDLDLCLRLRQAGYRCLYNPSVQAYHFESKTRGKSPHEKEYCQTFTSLWGPQAQRDPFYNRNLSRKDLFLEDWNVCRRAELLGAVRERLTRGGRAAA